MTSQKSKVRVTVSENGPYMVTGDTPLAAVQPPRTAGLEGDLRGTIASGLSGVPRPQRAGSRETMV